MMIESVAARRLLTAVPGAAGMWPHLYRGWFGAVGLGLRVTDPAAAGHAVISAGMAALLIAML